MNTADTLPRELSLPPRYTLATILKQTPSTLVCRVFDASDRREEAMKILRHQLDGPQVARFKAEFATLVSLDHANIIKVHDFGLLDDSYPYFTMEYFEGRKITEYFDGQSWDALYGVIEQIAVALHHIHHAGIIHLDLKPSNILVGGNGCAKLMDFGLSVDARKVLDRNIRGTLQYMAPEVLRQDRFDSRADLYALGMTLYETVTGSLPAMGKPPIDVIRMHLDEDIAPVSSVKPQVPPQLEQIIMKLLEKDPRNRYQTAAALLEAVMRASGRSTHAGEMLVGCSELFVAPLIGRRTELEQITTLIAEAREGRGNGVIVAGAEGIGKSRIVRDAVLRAQLDGARVFYGRCPVNRTTVLAPFFEIFQQLVTAVSPNADASEEIRRIIRAVVPGAAQNAPLPRGQKYRLFNRIVQSMQDIYGFLTVGTETSGSPLILVVEDLQWADASTVELFTFLVGEARHNKLLVIGTLDVDLDGEESIDAPAAGEWEERAREIGFPMIRLGPLSETLVRAHLQALLGSDDVPEELARWVLWESGGSPRNIRRIVDYLVTHDFLAWESDRWVADMGRILALRIPGGAASILIERFEAASARQRAVLEAIAVFGERCAIDMLVNLAEVPADETFAVAKDLARAGLVDLSSDESLVRFPQMHLREAVYNSMNERRRSELHLRAARTLEPMLLSGASQLVGQVAYHYARAAEQERGIRYSIEAGDLASRTLAHDEAAQFYRSALELMDLAGEDEATKAAVREKLADSYYRRDDYRRAMHSYQFLLKSIQSRSPENEPNPDIARVMKKIGKVLGKRGDHDGALAYFQNALAVYEQLRQQTEIAELLSRMAGLHREKADFAAARSCAERAREILEPMEPNVVFGYVKNMLGIIEYTTGNWQKAREILLEALGIGEGVGSEQLCKIVTTNLGNTLFKLGDWETALQFFQRNLQASETEGDLWDLVSAYNNVGVVEYGRGNFRAAADYFERSVRIDEKIGALEHEALARENLGDAYEMLGRWDAAMQQYERCLNLEGFDERRTNRSSVYVPMSRLMRKRGDIAKALDYGQKALNAAERARDIDLVAEACSVLAAIEEERDNLPEAEKLLGRAIAIFEENRTIHGLARAHTAAAFLVLRDQRLEDAIRHASKGGEYARTLGDRYTIARNEWAWARINAFRGERETAAAKFNAVKQLFEEIEAPHEMARLLFDIGLLCEEPEDATKTIRSAIKIFERLDARLDLERARGALYRIRPTGKAPDQNVVGLYEIVKIINSTLDLQEVLNRVIDVCLKRLRAERGMIILLDSITGALRTRVVRNINDTTAEAKRSPQSIVKEVINSGRSVMSADARTDARFVDSESVIAENIVSILCVPLIIKERISGAIYVDHRQARDLFAQKDLSFLEAFSDQAAIAIENARLYEELEDAKMSLSLENETLRREVLVDKDLGSLVGQSAAVSRIQFAIRKAAAGSSTVLLRGDSGTGKGLVARIIHNISPRRNGPFIKFNCAALPETLAESELFGHERGAFTGADRRKLGRFELANGGTIFLDEIGKITLAMQSKLLRVVEEKEFERVGGTQTIKTDVKIITATNLDLERAITAGTFREDLYYRLNIVPLTIPPLRERKDDIPLLTEHFIRKICRDLGIENKRLDHGVLDLFLRYDWPGNVRELEATLHRAIVMSNDETITRRDLEGLFGEKSVFAPSAAAQRAPSLLDGIVTDGDVTGEVYDQVMSSVDRRLIVRALESSGGRIREAARRLGLARNTLKSKILKYNITVRE